MSSKIEIYSKPNCTYCVKAKNLVKTLGFEYKEKMFGKDFKTPDELFEAVGKHSSGSMSSEELRELELVACPSAGACGGQFTANTMACVSEAIGLALPYSAR